MAFGPAAGGHSTHHPHPFLFSKVYLNLVLEYVPETVYRVAKACAKGGGRLPPLLVKLYVYQARQICVYRKSG